MRRPYAGFLAATALVVLAGHATSQCDNLPCEPRPTTNTRTTLNDYAGFSVAVDGDVAVAGAPGDYNSPYPFGAAYVYERQAGEWVAVARLEKSNPGTMDAMFGWSVDIIGDTIIVGDPTVYDNGIGSGAAYIYEEPLGGWGSMPVHMESALLRPTTIVGPPGNSQDNSQFRIGYSVALSADPDTAYVGVSRWNDNVSFAGRRGEGRVLVFREPSGGWSDAMAPLSDTAMLAREEDWLYGAPDSQITSLGTSLAVMTDPMTGLDRVFTGAVSDAAASAGTTCGLWVFDEPGGGWESSTTLEHGVPVNFAPMAAGPPLGTRLQFGISVDAFDMTTVAVGSFDEANGTTGSGMVRVYTDSGSSWVEETPPYPSAIMPCDAGLGIGRDVAFVDRNTLLAGSNSVGVYMLTRDPMTAMWSAGSRIVPRVLVPQNPFLEFGSSLAVSGSTYLVGVPIGYPGQPNRAGTMYELDLNCMCVTPISTPMAGITNWWTGDGDFMDLVGGQHGTPIGNTFLEPVFAGSGGFRFDDTGDAVDLGANAGNFGAEDFTVELWSWLFPAGSNISYSVWLEKHDGTQGWWIDNVSFGSNLRLVVESGATRVELTASGIPTFAAFRWTHFAVTRSGTTYTLYVNGEIVAQADDVVVDVSSTAPLYLGANQSLTGSVNGWLDEPALYDLALSQAEIREIVFAYGAAKCKDLDFVPPAITITSPMDGDVVHGLVGFNADVTDAGSGVEEVRFLVDGVQVGLPQTGSPFGVTLDTSDYDDGLRILTVEATDVDGNVGSDFIVVTVDNEPPMVVITLPVDMATVTGQFHFQAAATDGAGSGLTSVSMLANGMAPNDFDDSVVEFDPPEMATARRSRVNTHLILGNSVELSVTARDAAGHETTVQRTVTIERSGGSTQDGDGIDLSDITLDLPDAGFLVADDGRGPVTALVPLRRTRLELSQPHAFELRIQGSPPVRALAHRVLKGREPSVMLAFDRRQLFASLAAGVAAGEIHLRSGIEVELYVDGELMGVHRMRSGPGGERRK